MDGLPRIPGYLLGSAIGRDGWVTVYGGSSYLGGRPVAVRVDDRPVPESDRSGLATRLVALRAMSEHPNVVTVLDGGLTAGGRAYLVMEFCPGASMAARIRRDGPLPVERVLDVGFEMADALVTAHSFAIVHGNVSPGDILLDRSGEAQLSGFALTQPRPYLPLTVESTMLGVASAAPERVAGAPPTARTDVHSLGVTLYGLLTGHPAGGDHNEAGPATLVEGALLQPLPAAGIPGSDDLMPVLWRATAPDPADRYPDAAALRDALAAVRAGRPRSAGGIRPLLSPAADDEHHRIGGSSPPQAPSGVKPRLPDSESTAQPITSKPRPAVTWAVLALLVIVLVSAIVALLI